MAKFILAGFIGLVVIVIITALCGVGWGVGLLNDEAKQANLIKAKQVDNTNEYDNTWKSISQSAQVTEAQAKALTDIAVQYAQARTGAGGGGSLIDVKAVHEVVPNMDASTFKTLMNIITSKRDGFAMRQKELIALNNVHDNMVDPRIIPSGWLCSMFGRKPIDIKIVTSTRTDNAFNTGKDDDTKVFSK